MATRPISHRPARVGATLAIGAALIGAVGTVAYTPGTGLVGVVGATLVVLGLILPRPGVISIGAVLVFLAVVLGAAQGLPVPVALGGTVGAILAWDLAHNAASHGRQVGRGAQSATAEFAHFAGSFGTGVLGAGGGYIVYRFVSVGQPSVAIGILVLGSIIAAIALS